MWGETRCSTVALQQSGAGCRELGLLEREDSHCPVVLTWPCKGHLVFDSAAVELLLQMR